MSCKYCDTVHPKKEIANPHYCIARMEEAKEKLEDEIDRLKQIEIIFNSVEIAFQGVGDPTALHISIVLPLERQIKAWKIIEKALAQKKNLVKQ